MAPRFAECLAFVLQREGGWSDVKGDRGGATACGITNATYQHWRHAHDLPAGGDLKRITPEEVAAIYREDYWTPARCDSFAPPVDLVHFDGSVNHGRVQAARFLQRAVGAAADGVIGPKTLVAVASLPPAQVAQRVIAQREAFYHWLAQRPDQVKFLRGWLARMVALRAACGLS